MNSNLPQYVSKTRFFELLDVCFLTGQKLLDREVLRPDAELHGETPLFEHSGEKIAESHKAIQAYRHQLKLSKYNLNQN